MRISPILRSLIALSCLAAAAGAQSAPSARDALLVTPGWLADHLKDPNVVVLFMGQPPDFEKGHIPGARFVDFRGISVQDSTGKGLTLEMPPAQQLHETFVKLGVSDNSRVIVYYNGRTGGPVSIATRLVMTLDHAGLGKNAALLDGGQVAWVAAGNALTTDVAAVQPGHLSALTIKPVIVTADFVRDHIAKPGFSIVDGRAAAFYDGVQTGGGQNSPHKTGHVASAKNVPYTEIVDETGKLKAADQLAALFSKAGVAKGDTVIGYCHIGQQATAMLFAARTLRYPILFYDGSFEDWSRRDYPVDGPAKKSGSPE